MILLLWLATLLPQETPEPPADASAQEATSGEDPALQHEVLRMSRQVEDLLAARFQIRPAAVRATAQARRIAAEARLAQAIPTQRLEARGRAWEDIGLGSREGPSRIYRLLAEDVDGVAVDAAGRRLLVDPDRLTVQDFTPTGEETDPSSVLLMTGIRPDEPLLLHGLVHLLQQQGELGAWPETTDLLLASRAWREGQANLVAILYLFASVGVGTELFSHSLDPGEVMGGALLPPSLDLVGGVEGALLDWVYRDGYGQAAASIRNGGPSALREAMASRPTTRDVRHLDRAALTPSEIAIPDEPAPEGLRLVDRDSVGEEAIVAIVSFWTGKANLGLIAADGWSGDALLRWEGAEGDGVTLWITRWVSAQEAADFEYGYVRSLESRFPSSDAGEGRRRFEGQGRAITVSREGNYVRVRIVPVA
jgi:hypothetical protein